MTEVADEIRRLAYDMIETMYAAKGVGLAAPQVGVALRVIVFDRDPQGKRRRPMGLVNPRIVEAEGEEVAEEGCLSLPDIRGDIRRAARVLVEGLSLEGQPVQIEAEGISARLLQHEIDHLDGILIIDRMSTIRRRLLNKRLKELKQKMEAETRRKVA